MSGQRGMNSDVRRLTIANFAHHDDIGILANEGTQRRREGQPNLWLHLRLVHTTYFVLDRILYCENFPRRIVERGEHGCQGSGLATACWTSDDDNAMGKNE